MTKSRKKPGDTVRICSQNRMVAPVPYKEGDKLKIAKSNTNEIRLEKLKKEGKK